MRRFDHSSDLSVRSVHGFHRRRDLNHIGGAADVQSCVDGARFAELQIDLADRRGFESGLGNRHRVAAHRQGRDLIEPLLAGLRDAMKSGGRGFQLDLSGGDQGPRGVRNRAVDRCAVLRDQT